MVQKNVERKYKNSYLKYGFIEDVNKKGHPFCLICMKTFANSLLKENKLKGHFLSKHPTLQNNPESYF